MTKEELLRMLDEVLPRVGNPLFLATWDGRFPRVRPMALVRDGLRFYVGTGRDDAKTRQITAHPQVEFVVLLTEGGLTGYIGYMRVAGTAVEVVGVDKHEAWARGKGPDMTEYYPGGLDDPKCIVFRIEPESVRLMMPGEPDEQELPRAWFA